MIIFNLKNHAMNTKVVFFFFFVKIEEEQEIYK